MNITQIAIKRPITTVMIILAVVLLGVIGYTRLQVARFPRFSFPNITISVAYPGASAQDADQLVAVPIAQAMKGLPGVRDISTTSREGQANISLTLADNADQNQAVIDVQRTLGSFASRLPPDISPPNVIKADPSIFPIMNIAFTGDVPLTQLSNLAINTIAPALQQIPGVAQVNVIGALQSQVQVQVDPTALQSYGLTLQQVQRAVGQDNLNSAAGGVLQGASAFDLRVSSRVTRADQFNDIVLRSGPTGTVYLKDVASVVDTYAPQRSILRLDGRQGLGISVVQQSDANTVDTVKAVKGQLAQFERALPKGTVLTVTNDASRFTKSAIDAVQRDLVIAILICGAVLMLFLHAWRNTVVVLLAIPTSMIATFLAMYLIGFTLNTISLMALALLVGILVDDSIVVLENIHRHRKLGEEPLLAALNGRNEIGLAAIAITLTDVVVWVPIAFIAGSLGVIMKEFGLTIIVATLFSLFISFTLTPMLAAHWLRSEKVDEVNKRVRRGLLAPFRLFPVRWEAGMDWVIHRYRGVLRWSLGHRAIVLLAGAAAFGAAYLFLHFNILGREYSPTEDDGQFSLQIQTPPGSSLATTSQAMAELEQGVLGLPEVTHVFSSVGGGGGFAGSAIANSGNMSIQLVDKGQRDRSTLAVLEEARTIARTIPNVVVTGNIQSALGGGGPPISIRILGADINRVTAISEQVLKIVANTPGATDVRLQEQPGAPSLEAVVDRTRTAPLGISAVDVSTTLRTAVSGSVVSRLDRPDGTQSDVVMRIAGADTMTPAQLATLPVFSPVIGRAVRMDQVASVRQITGPSQINRSAGGQSLRMTISAGVSGRPLGDVASDIQSQVNKLTLPPGHRVVLAGQVDRLNQAFSDLLQASFISAALIFMLLAALYEDLLQPLAIIVSLPLALVGAFTGLWLTHNTLNLFSMIGMIMLMGLVAKNAILLVDYTNTLRTRNVPRREAILEAGATRLRPILMTTSTIVFSMVPLALKLEAGAESRAPIAVAIIGGVISSLLLTLVVVPVAYTVFDDAPGWLRAFLRSPGALKRRASTILARPGLQRDAELGRKRAPEVTPDP